MKKPWLLEVKYHGDEGEPYVTGTSWYRTEAGARKHAARLHGMTHSNFVLTVKYVEGQ